MGSTEVFIRDVIADATLTGILASVIPSSAAISGVIDGHHRAIFEPIELTDKRPGEMLGLFPPVEPRTSTIELSISAFESDRSDAMALIEIPVDRKRTRSLDRYGENLPLHLSLDGFRVTLKSLIVGTMRGALQLIVEGTESDVVGFSFGFPVDGPIPLRRLGPEVARLDRKPPNTAVRRERAWHTERSVNLGEDVARAGKRTTSADTAHTSIATQNRADLKRPFTLLTHPSETRLSLIASSYDVPGSKGNIGIKICHFAAPRLEEQTLTLTMGDFYVYRAVNQPIGSLPFPHFDQPVGNGEAGANLTMRRIKILGWRRDDRSGRYHLIVQAPGDFIPDFHLSINGALLTLQPLGRKQGDLIRFGVPQISDDPILSPALGKLMLRSLATRVPERLAFRVDLSHVSV